MRQWEKRMLRMKTDTFLFNFAQPTVVELNTNEKESTHSFIHQTQLIIINIFIVITLAVAVPVVVVIVKQLVVNLFFPFSFSFSFLCYGV